MNTYFRAIKAAMEFEEHDHLYVHYLPMKLCHATLRSQRRFNSARHDNQRYSAIEHYKTVDHQKKVRNLQLRDGD